MSVERVGQVTALRAEVHHIHTSMAQLHPYLFPPLVPSDQQQAINSPFDHRVQPAVFTSSSRSSLTATASRQQQSFLPDLLPLNENSCAAASAATSESMSSIEVQQLPTKSAEVQKCIAGDLFHNSVRDTTRQDFAVKELTDKVCSS